MIETELAAPAEICVEAKALLFDMDGVLVSSIAAVERCWKRWCEIYEVPDAANFQVPHGVRARDTMHMLKPEWNEAQLSAGLRVIEDLEIADADDLKVLPGVRALLARLPVERWAIVTSATRRLLLGRLAAAELPVPERLISGDMVACGKPDPEPYRRGAELLGIRPEDCVVVEDAPSGVSAGIAAGCRVLAVLGTHEASQLNQATWLLNSLEGITATLDGAGLELRFVPVVGHDK